MIDSKNIFITPENEEMFDFAIKDIRASLTKFKSKQQASLYDIAFLNTICNHLMTGAVVIMNTSLDENFNMESESPLLDTCEDFSDICELMQDPSMIPLVKEITKGKRVKAKNVFIHSSKDLDLDEHIKSMRNLLSMFKRDNKASLYDIASLNMLSNHIFSKAIFELTEYLNIPDSRFEEFPILDISLEYQMMCGYLQDPEKAMANMDAIDDMVQKEMIETFH